MACDIDSYWCYRLQPSSGSTWSPPPPPPPTTTSGTKQTPLLLLKYQYLTKYIHDWTRHELGYSTSVTLGPSGYLAKNLDLFANRPCAMYTLLNMMTGTELWSTIPSNSGRNMIRQIGYAMFEHTRPPTGTNNHVTNICLELDIILCHHIVYHIDDHFDDDGEYERALNESFDVEQAHAVLRPAPPELLESLVAEVCTGETKIEYQCMICMEEFIAGAKIQRLPCSHCFHEDCILCWFREKTTCPICRYGEQYSLSAVE